MPTTQADTINADLLAFIKAFRRGVTRPPAREALEVGQHGGDQRAALGVAGAEACGVESR